MPTTIDNSFAIEDAIAILERTPASLRAMLEGLSEPWIRATEGGDTWSPFDVIGHLIQGERADWMVRARHILSGDARPFQSFDRTAQFAGSRGRSLRELLSTFAELRRENLDALRGMRLTDEDLVRTGLHPELGQVTLAQLLATWVVHDLDHIAQVVRTMARVYRSATGPWIAYLSILKDRQK